MKLFNQYELDLVNSYYDNNDIGFRDKSDRSYKFVIFNNKESKIVDKLLDWFELESGEKIKNRDSYLFLHKYETGDYFTKHKDEAVIADKHREYVVGFHINDDYKGGNYKLYNPESTIDKTPGVPYFFKANREHEITPIINGIRKSALMFIYSEDLYKKTSLI